MNLTWIRRWPVPRWLPLSVAWVGGPTLAGYGLFMITALTGRAAGVLDIDAQERVWMVFGGSAFGGYGSALTLAAWSYQHRTRPHCPEANTVASGHPESVPAPRDVPG